MDCNHMLFALLARVCCIFLYMFYLLVLWFSLQKRALTVIHSIVPLFSRLKGGPRFGVQSMVLQTLGRFKHDFELVDAGYVHLLFLKEGIKRPIIYI